MEFQPPHLIFQANGGLEMVRKSSKITILFLLLLDLLAVSAYTQPSSQEIGEDDGIPVLVKHLPEWQSVRSSTVSITDSAGLAQAVGARPIVALIEFAGGTEAVKADYAAGKLLIVEFTNPQGSSDADAKILRQLAENPEPTTVYKRIGNYNAFVFDAADQNAAAGLLDQVKYQKTIQWLGEDPYLAEKIGRYFATTARDVMLSTVMWIVGGLGLSIVLGIIAGLVFFRMREQQRATWSRFTDAGGMTRLNLDELSE